MQRQIGIANEERPHHALGLQTPAAHYARSPRPYPEDLPEITCPTHFEVRRVSTIGVVNWKRILVSRALANEPLGFVHIAPDVWSVFFGDILLGRIVEGEAGLVIGSGR